MFLRHGGLSCSDSVRRVVKQGARVERLARCCRSKGTRFITICKEEHVNGACLIRGLFGSRFTFRVSKSVSTPTRTRLSGFNCTLHRFNSPGLPLPSG